MPADEMESRYQKETARVAGKLFRAISQRQALRPAFLSLMMFKIQQSAWQREDSDSYDYIHWENQGWFEPACTFYIAHRASRVKVALARLVGAVVARFVTQ